MATIEKRAKDYAPDVVDADFILPVREGYIINAQRVAYISGATDQRQIDVYKACEWLDEFDEKYRDSTHEEFVEQFRKAMMEE